MIAKFDSYKRFETPLMYVCNPGCVLRNGLLSNVAGVLNDVGDVELNPTFNAVSELNFRAYKVRCEDPEENAYRHALYQSLKNKRLIYLEDIGFFVIKNVKEGERNKQKYKDISAGSCELELQSKEIPYIANGTYKFYTGEAGSPGLIEMVFAPAPMWSIGHIDAAVSDRYRTFEDVDVSLNILGFTLDQLQDAYECIFIFDIENRIVDIYDQANYVRPTDIHITNADLINQLDVEESSDDLYTAIRVTGDEELSINAVNPLGTNVIYRFDYYLDWMTPALSEKVRAWQELVKSCYDEYYALQLSRYESLTELSALEAERDRIKTQLEMYIRCRENIVAEASYDDIKAYNDIIIEAGGIPIPDDVSYMWIKFADDAYGTNLTEDPYGKNYIGIAYDMPSSVPSFTSSDYQWSTFRNGETFSRTVNGETVYTWIVFADSVTSGMSSDPDGKKYIGIAEDRGSPDKSDDYSTYTWALLNTGNLGVPQVLAKIISLVEQTEEDLAAIEADIAGLNEIINTKNDRVALIQNDVAIKNYFSAAELEELSNYISEGSYSDEYVTVTESMNYADRFAQMKLLYDRAQTQLEKISTPTQQIKVDVENFIFQKEFADWSEQLETGCLINVELEADDVAALFLCSFSVNYSDKKLSMTFGNRYNRFDPKALFENVLGDISKTANTLSYIKDTIYPIKNGEFNAMREALETSRTLSKNAVLSSSNEQVTIDDTGYTGRRKLPDGTIDPKQIKINGRNIVFTDDAWETCKTAIGELILSDGATAYGINAEVLLGDIIMGNELHILNDKGEDMFKVTEDAAVLRIGDTFAEKSETISKVDVEYCRTTSSTDPPDDSNMTVAWSTSAPPWASGEYIWQRTVTTYGEGTVAYSDATCILGAQGEAGRGISSTTIYYALSDSVDEPPTEGWSDIFPSSMDEGKHLWTRTLITYSDGEVSEFYSVSTSGIGIDTIVEEYYLSTSDTEQIGGTWTNTPPVWSPDTYIWTRSHIYWDNGSDEVTEPVLSNTWNQMGAAIGDCATEININKRGIEQNTAFYQELYGMVAKINAYIQTGVINVDEDGKTSFGVKIGENFASTDAYIISGSTEYSSGWLSNTDGGIALVPMEAIIYTVKTPGAYQGKHYRWNGESYEETSSEGTLSSVFTSSELGFYDTGEKTAYFSNKNLNVRTVRTNKILLSEDVISDTSSNNWQIGIDNGFYLKWVGA